MTDIAALARQAHAGQVDRAGRDYFDAHLTPIAAAAACFGPDAEAAGWLHDVLEDTDLTATDLAGRGVPPAVVEAVESVTRRSDETYEELITRAAAHPLGCLVKLVDNAWNIASNPGLAALDPGTAAAMLADRYRPARVRLLAAAELTDESPVMTAVHDVLERQQRRLDGA